MNNTVAIVNGVGCNLEELKGFVPPGWGKIVENLVSSLYLSGWDGKVQQIKEKFGGLRFYINGSDDMQNIIKAAERESIRTCQKCGKDGKTRSYNGWLETLCSLHNVTRDML